MQPTKFSVRRRIKSFQFAFNGLYLFFSTQHNAIVHAIATVGVLIAAAIVRLPVNKLLFLVVAIALVWMAELFNTALEKLCDMVCPQRHPTIKYIKDLSAAAVFVTALMAVITACIIFIPVFI